MRVLVVFPTQQGSYPAEAEKQRLNAVLAFNSPDVEITMGFPEEGSGFEAFGVRTADIAARNHIAVAQRLAKAEAEGYDAAIPFGMPDFGVELARSQANIPIVGQAQAAYCMASLMCDRFGVISYQDTGGHGNTWRQIRNYGFLHMLVGFGAAGMHNREMHARRDELFERFVSEGKRLVKEGAELIICHGMSMSPVEYPANEYGKAIGVPVLDGMSCALALAKAWHMTGTPPSRIRYPKRGGA